MDEQAVNMVNELIAKARVAQKQFESFSQEKTDEAVRAIGKVVLRPRRGACQDWRARRAAWAFTPIR